MNKKRSMAIILAIAVLIGAFQITLPKSVQAAGGDYTINGTAYSWSDNNVITLSSNNDTLEITSTTSPAISVKINITAPDSSTVTISGTNGTTYSNVYVEVMNNITLNIKDLSIIAPQDMSGIKFSKDNHLLTTTSDNRPDINLDVTGQCRLEGAGSGDGINSEYNQKLFITGSGALTAVGGNNAGPGGDALGPDEIGPDGDYKGSGGDGIRMNAIKSGASQCLWGSTLTINGADLTLLGGSSQNASGGQGIHIKWGDMVVNSGRVIATGGLTNSNIWMNTGILITCSDAIYGGHLTVNGGQIEATGGYTTGATNGGNGISADSKIDILGGSVSAKGGNSTTEIGGMGIYEIREDIIVSGGTLSGIGGNGAASGSHGIYDQEGDVIIQPGASVSATGGTGTTGAGGAGIYTYNGGIVINGGTVSSTGGDGRTNGSHAILASEGDITIKQGANVSAIGGNGTTGVGGTGIRAYGNGTGKTVTIEKNAGEVYIRGGQGKDARRASIMGKDIFIATGNVAEIVMEGSNPRSIKNTAGGDDLYMLTVSTSPAAVSIVQSSVTGTLAGTYTYKAPSKQDGISYMWLPAATQVVEASGYHSGNIIVPQDNLSTLTLNLLNKVTGISGVPAAGVAGTDLILSGTVTPANADNQTIVWSLKDAGTTGAVINGTTLSAMRAGTVVVTATVANGTGEGSDYTEDFSIIITGAPALIIATPTFSPVTVGYLQPAAAALTITNSGTSGAAIVSVSSSDTNKFIVGGSGATVAAGNSITSWTVQPVAGLDIGTHTSVITVAYDNNATTAASVSLVVSAPSYNGSGNSIQTPTSSPTSSTTPTPKTSNVPVIVNGRTENIGTASTTAVGNRTVTTITLDSAELRKKLDSGEDNATVTIPVSAKSDVIVSKLTGDIVKRLENKAAVFEVTTTDATYKIKAKELYITEVAAQFGTDVPLTDLSVQVEIAKADAATTKIVEDTSKNGEFSLIVAPIQFAVTAFYGGRSVTLDNFKSYVERTISIPDGVDPNKITTGVVVKPDGTSYHVPTYIKKTGDRYYAVINSLTNSTYCVVWHSVEFADVAKHWAKDAVNNIGSRMIITGVAKNTFMPDKDITRAEFATIMVKALGLAPENGKTQFADVEKSQWYAGYIQTAYKYGIIAGYNANTFAPDDNITREQAMTIIAKAMKITGLAPQLSKEQAQVILSKYTDSQQITAYASENIAACLETTVVQGRTKTTISPKSSITRGEVAMLVQNLLKKSHLID